MKKCTRWLVAAGLLVGGAGASAALRVAYVPGTTSATSALSFDPFTTRTTTASTTTTTTRLSGTGTGTRPPYIPPTRSPYIPDDRPDPLP